MISIFRRVIPKLFGKAERMRNKWFNLHYFSPPPDVFISGMTLQYQNCRISFEFLRRRRRSIGTLYCFIMDGLKARSSKDWAICSSKQTQLSTVTVAILRTPASCHRRTHHPQPTPVAMLLKTIDTPIQPDRMQYRRAYRHARDNHAIN